MWLKTYYPVEFFAAALSIVKDDKLPGLVSDAEAMEIEILPPDINHSTDQFEILTDLKLLIPFNRVKGLSTHTAAAILKAREAGPFTSKDEFISRVERRKCNIGHQDKLDRVGAFAGIEPGQLPPRHPDRLSDQKELIPGLISGAVAIKRAMDVNSHAKGLIGGIIADYSATTTGMVKACLGKSARFMVITDCPNAGEEKQGSFAFGESFTPIQTALAEAGLSRADGYWTGLIKRPKFGKQVDADEIREFLPFLRREIEALKPPLILLLGSSVARQFFPELKGAIIEHAGKVIHNKEMDCNFVIGFAPGMIWFDPDKQETLNGIFAQVAEMI
jgi:DNA polymerase-3 subunit alpha